MPLATFPMALNDTSMRPVEAFHTEECILYAILTGKVACQEECAALRETILDHPNLRYSTETLIAAATTREVSGLFSAIPEEPVRHTDACLITAAQTGEAFCFLECKGLRQQNPRDLRLKHGHARLQQAAQYAMQQHEEENRVTLECPGCHREISGPHITDRGVTCPHCHLGISADLVPRPAEHVPEPTDMLDVAMAEADEAVAARERAQRRIAA